MLEEVEDELLGEIDSKDTQGPGEATADELLVSGVRPANKHTTHTHTYKVVQVPNVNASTFLINLLCRVLWALVASCTAKFNLHLSFQAASSFRA